MSVYTPSAQLAYNTLTGNGSNGIPTGLIHIMEHSVIERLACVNAGEYIKDPFGVYFQMLENIGVNMVDQMLADNPLSMGSKGFEGGTAGNLMIDGVPINSPEDCADHMENVDLPALRQRIKDFNEVQIIRDVILSESAAQRMLGPNILKTGYGHLMFPTLEYVRYGYENFFMAYALYPEIVDNLFKLQADYAVLNNTAVVNAFQTAGLPLYHRLDHDMADSRGLLVGIKSLERCWIEQFARSVKPAVDAGFTLLWHCDGNLMALIPYLLEAGVNGFQGFQYEAGMDYIQICKLKNRAGRDLVIQAGVSVTRELPFGKPADIKNHMRFLVENGPKTGLFLSFSSSCVPGTPFENIITAIEGLQYYRTNGSK
jgi:hypothetical protein